MTHLDFFSPPSCRCRTLLTVHDKRRSSVLKNHFDSRLQIKAFMSITCSSTNTVVLMSLSKHVPEVIPLNLSHCSDGEVIFLISRDAHMLFLRYGSSGTECEVCLSRNQRQKNQNTNSTMCPSSTGICIYWINHWMNFVWWMDFILKSQY